MADLFNDTKDLPKGTFAEVAAHIGDIGRNFYQRGWVMGTSGNFSAVLQRQPLQLAITSSGVDKGALTEKEILRIDGSGKVIEGVGKPSAETSLHLVIVQLQSANAVLHTHSVWGSIVSDKFAADGGVKIEHYEMLKGLQGVTTHQHTEWLPICLHGHLLIIGTDLGIRHGLPGIEDRLAEACPVRFLRLAPFDFGHVGGLHNGLLAIHATIGPVSHFAPERQKTRLKDHFHHSLPCLSFIRLTIK